MLSTDFVIGEDDFSDLSANPTDMGEFHYFFNERKNSLVKRFLLDKRSQVSYFCQVTLIRKGEKFTPRPHFLIENNGRPARVKAPLNEETIKLKASVNLDQCHDNFWQLVSYLKSLSTIEVPDGSFSLVSKDDRVIVDAIRKKDVNSMKSIVMELCSTPNLTLTAQDIGEMLMRQEKLEEFSRALKRPERELWWQQFFKKNDWIFGYGLNYVVLTTLTNPPYVGGMQYDGSSGQFVDFMSASGGDARFTVLIEIKTPETDLLSGNQVIRSHAWGLSSQLTDAVAQTQANVARWGEEDSKRLQNVDALERKQDIYTVQPKGIIVIGSLSKIKDDRDKREGFQRFRQSLHGIEILTFDELYDRACFIVNRAKQR